MSPAQYQPGQVIISQTEPFVHALKSRFKDGACDWCFARERYDGCFLQKCGKCRIQYYCSKVCQTKDWNSGHKCECRYFRKPKFDFKDLCDGSQSRAEWARIMFRMVVKLKSCPDLMTTKFRQHNENKISVSELKFIPNKNTGVKEQHILPMTKAEAFKRWYGETFREDTFSLEELWKIQSKLEANCFQISNPNGMFPMGVGLYMETGSLKRVSFEDESRVNAEVQFIGNEIQVKAKKQIQVGEDVVVLEGDPLGSMMSGMNVTEMVLK